MTTTIADTILNALGGMSLINRALDVKLFLRAEDGLGIRLKKMDKNKINHIEIADLSPDGYSIKFYQIRKPSDQDSLDAILDGGIKLIAAHHKLPAEQLVDVLNRELNLELPTGDQTQNAEIAQTIISQMRGERVLMPSLWVSKYYPIKQGVKLHFKTGRNGINALRVTLNNDLYTMQFLKCGTQGEKVVAEYSRLFCDQLVRLLESTTGHFLYA